MLLRALTLALARRAQPGVIEGSFGKSGKFKVRLDRDATVEPRAEVKLRFKRFYYDEKKAMHQ